MRTKVLLCMLMTVVVLSAATQARAGRLNVAVFNFQMKSQTPEWKWFQKGLADQITTDFTRSRQITVIARDEMQLLAKKVRWAPEMATTAVPQMEQIKKQLKIDHLVTGIYTIKDDQIKITAQIIKVDGRKEVARKVVSGATKDVLDLQKRVSAELLGWFSGVPAEKILPHLPVWTRSIKATKALYRGMHLYDEGRYAEAWVKFRQAWRNDPSYLEAHYWVARMYYFMDRYEHARRAYEKFVYMDRSHPRIGDAIKEYLHTYEKLDTPPETLLELYADFIRRFPEVMIYNEVGEQGPVTNRVWLQVRSGQLLGQLGRHRDAALLASTAMDELRQKRFWWTNWAYYVAMRGAQAHHMLTGSLLVPKGLAECYRQDNDRNVQRFRPGHSEVRVVFDGTRKVYEYHVKNRVCYRDRHVLQLIVASDGYVFKKISLYPIVEGKYGKITCWLNRDVHMDLGYEGYKTSEDARKTGFHFDNIPRCGIFHVVFYLCSNNIWRDPEVRLHGYRAVVETEKVGPHGAIMVAGMNTDNFSVYVDDCLSRKRGGLIGLIRPGRRRVNFRSRRSKSQYATHEETVDVKAGKTTRLEVTLPWKKDSPWTSWTTGTLIGRDYPSRNPCLQTCMSAPTIQADNKAIRVFWSYRGDLWSSISTDGDKFSRPRKLAMPISSGWIEQDPLCFRDESGRFLLAFRSDREGQHQMRAYLCWSRDGVHWSRPAMVIDRTVNKFDIIQDDKGQFIWADASGKKVTIMKSRDGYRWEQAAQWPLENDERAIRIFHRSDGMYELFLAEIFLELKENKSYLRHRLVVRRYISKDCSTWSKGQEITRFFGDTDISMSVLHVRGQTLVGFLKEHIFAVLRPFVRFVRERANGTFEQSENFWDIGSYYGAMAHHPRWGYMITWHHPPHPGRTLPVSGPFLIRGKSIEQFFPKKKPK
ncbi:MAG: hypothetical protein KAV00_00475 [Phycisphaerae bacterium]|nr:hypothetical protein [Phycisphaerae bacterium]